MKARIFAAVLAVAAWGIAGAQAPDPNLKNEIGIDQKLDSQVPLDAVFTDSEGKQVTLGQYFGKRPVVLIPVFYECKGVCTTILTNVTRTFRSMVKADAGREFEAVTISIHPKETPAMAAQAKKDFLAVYNRPGAEKGWHFLVGSLDQIHKVTDAIGYRYKYDPATDNISHPAGIVVLTPKGRTSRYYYGIEFPAKLVAQSVIDAGQNRIGKKVEPMFWGCVMYDPKSGKYRLVVDQALKVGGVLTLLILGTSIFILSRKSKPSEPEGGAPNDPA